MKIRRREFLRRRRSQAWAWSPVAACRRRMRPRVAAARRKPPTYTPKIELLWKSPDRYPNALEASPEGLWVGDQVSERINLLDWKTGKVLEDFVGEAHNTSGLAVGRRLHLDRLQRRRHRGEPAGVQAPVRQELRRDRQARHEGQAGKGLPHAVGRRRTARTTTARPTSCGPSRRAWASWPRWIRKTTCASAAWCRSA